MRELNYKDPELDKITPLYYLVDIPGYEKWLNVADDELKLTNEEHDWIEYVDEVQDMVR